MNAPSALLRLGERLSRVPRRLAAAAALLAILAIGGLGLLLASSQPAARAGTGRTAGWVVTPPAQPQWGDDWDDDWEDDDWNERLWRQRQRPPAPPAPPAPPQGPPAPPQR
jgi:hypothetical protein